MRFEVPQFIDVEDKIFGPFTWKQFIYLAGGGGLSLILFLMLPFLIFAVLATPVMLLAGALAFYPVNDRPFSRFLESVVRYFTRSRLYLWHQNTESAKAPAQATTANAPVYAPPKGNNIAHLSRKLELNAVEKK